MRVTLGLVGLAACYAPHPQLGAQCASDGSCPSGLTCVNGTCGGDGLIDGAITFDAPPLDAPPDGVPACAIYGKQHFFDPCALPVPMPLGDLDLPANGQNPSYILHTDSATLYDRNAMANIPIATVVNGDGSLIVSVSSFELAAGATLRIDGPVPAVIASWSTIAIDGILDVAGHHINGLPGAGSNPSSCHDGQDGAPGDASDGAGGAGGGGGNQVGGSGGSGDSGTNDGGLHGAIEQGAPTIVEGGCNGGHGGSGGSNASANGTGGGAIHLDAATSIEISGTITANGSGGKGGFAPYGGGGGGGAGGYIGLEAPTVMVMSSAIIVSNGGAGGGGADDMTGNGSPGQDGQLSGTAAAVGGPANGDMCGTSGAAGGYVQTDAGGTVTLVASCGGGGGGGATGYMIKISANLTVMNGATISPSIKPAN